MASVFASFGDLSTFCQKAAAALSLASTPLAQKAALSWLEDAPLEDDEDQAARHESAQACIAELADRGILVRTHYSYGGGLFHVATAFKHAALLAAERRGDLARFAQFVQQRAPTPASGYFGAKDLLARDLLLAMYGQGDKRAFQACAQLTTARGHSEDPFLLHVFGVDAPAEGVARLPEGLRHAYLDAAAHACFHNALRLGEGLVQSAVSEREALSGRTRALCAASLALGGGLAQARDLLLGDGPESELRAAHAFVSLCANELARARAEAVDAVQATSTKSGKVKGVTGALGAWVSLLLMTSADPEHRPLATAQLGAFFRRAPSGSASPDAMRALQAFLSGADGRLAASELAALAFPSEWEELLLVGFVLRLLGSALPEPLRRRTEEMLAWAEGHALSWVREQLTGLLSPKPHGVLFGLYTPEEPWQRVLRALDASVDQAEQLAEPEDAREERLVWQLLLEGSHYVLTPRLQTRGARGFSSGRTVSLKKLVSLAAQKSFLDEHDRRVLAYTQTERTAYAGTARTALSAEAPLGLVGHPRVYADAELKQHVDVVRGQAQLEVQEGDSGLSLAIEPRELLGEPVLCLPEGDARIVVFALTKAQALIASRFEARGLRLPSDARPELEKTLARLAKHFPVASAAGLGAAHVRAVDPERRLHVLLRANQAGLHVRITVAPLGTALRFSPGEGHAEVLGVRLEDGASGTVRTRRDLDDENTRYASLIDACPALLECLGARNEAQSTELLHSLELLEQLKALGDEIVLEWTEGAALTVLGERDLRDFSLSLRTQDTWLRAEGALPIDDDLKLSLRELLRLNAEAKGRFVRLDDGRYLALTESLKKTLDAVTTLARETQDGPVLLHPLSLSSVAEVREGLASLEVDAATETRLANMERALTLEPEVPSALEAELRPYQEQGFAWLVRLSELPAGACLADDMGLGKTLQALALLLYRAERGPSLVVAPTSVCNNWLAETQRFAPSLRLVHVASGEHAQRLEDLGPHDLVITSYGVMQAEIESFRKLTFNVLIADEAQAIKNAAAQRTRALLQLSAGFRVALTGTPVENHLGELWSLMHFLNPGLLGSLRSFEQRFLKPIQRDRDPLAQARLKRLVRPFVLRRKKSEVLDDLPPKTVVTLRVEPSPAERALYAALRDQARAKISAPKDQGKARIQLLAELTRMRRAACHPSLVVPNAGLESAKLEYLEVLLDELREGRHRALVFSQFVDYLRLVQERLVARGVRHQYLDGSTPLKERERAVRSFQAGEGDVFLISLKAGGFGLNLTAADYVVHLDPWWNPAVEDQASDRAHRIGQTRPVTIYRLVMRDSIEERIMALHGEKRDLADKLLEGTGKSDTLSFEELLEVLGDDSGPHEARPKSTSPAARASERAS